MSERVQLQDQVRDLCERFGVKYERTAKITVWPDHAEVVVFLERDGQIYVDPQTNAPAVETQTFQVRT